MTNGTIKSLSFDFLPSPESNDHQVRPAVDRLDFLEQVGEGGLGIDPPEFFTQSALYEGGDLLVGRCSCGVVGCGDVFVTVDCIDAHIVWKDHRGGVHVFDRDRYIATVEQASIATDWESPQRCAERLISKLDFSSVEQTGHVYEWASTRIGKQKITLSFRHHGKQRLFEIPWNATDPEDAARKVRRWISEFAI